MPSTASVRAWSERPAVRARAADAVYGVLGLVDSVSTVAQWWHRPVFAIVTGLLSLVATVVVVLFRRRAPMAAFLVTVPPTAVGGASILLPLAVMAFAIRRRTRALVPVIGLGCLAVLVNAYINDALNLATGVASGVLLALFVSFGSFVGARRDLVTSLRERADEAEANARLLEQGARLAERTLIAREMHDVVAHRISLVALHAGALEVNPGTGSDRVEKAAALIGATARQALEDLRGVLGVLRSDAEPAGTQVGPDLTPQPRLTDVHRLVESSVTAGVKVTFEDRRPPGAPEADELVGRTVYRVVQEALTNVHKHARDAGTRVVLTGGGGEPLTVEVSNARPVATSALVPGSGAGLVGLRERVALVGGTLEAGPDARGGWRVVATFTGRRP